MNKVYMICGLPGSGKSTVSKKYACENNCSILNRDSEGGTIKELLPKFESLLKDNKSVLLDNLFLKAEVRKPFLDLANKYNVKTKCIHVKLPYHKGRGFCN